MASTPSTSSTSGDADPFARQPSRGAVTLISGCMFSGKTTQLVQRVLQHRPEGCMSVKHSKDQRYAEQAIVTHGGLQVPARPISCPTEILNLINADTTLVAIDEAHFFDRTLIEVVKTLRIRGIDVVITSLEPDSWGVGFPIVKDLLAVTEDWQQKTATCTSCGQQADRTQRLTPIVDGNMIEGPGAYEPRCRKCWVPPPEERPAN